ncbi:MAG: hypothetical protein ABH881_01590 [bacterium]
MTTNSNAALQIETKTEPPTEKKHDSFRKDVVEGYLRDIMLRKERGGELKCCVACGCEEKKHLCSKCFHELSRKEQSAISRYLLPEDAQEIRKIICGFVRSDEFAGQNFSEIVGVVFAGYEKQDRGYRIIGRDRGVEWVVQNELDEEVQRMEKRARTYAYEYFLKKARKGRVDVSAYRKLDERSLIPIGEMNIPAGIVLNAAYKAFRQVSEEKAAEEEARRNEDAEAKLLLLARNKKVAKDFRTPLATVVVEKKDDDAKGKPRQNRK